MAAPLNAPINVVAYSAPLLVLATNAEFAVSLTFPVTALPNNTKALPEVCVVTLIVLARVAVVALATVPVTFAPAIALRPLPLPVNIPVFAVNATAVTVPLTPKLVNVPTLVMLGCAAVVTVPAVVALSTLIE